LRGNHSFTNLHRSTSGGSGIFIGEDSETEQDDEPMHKIGSWSQKVGSPEGYIKTSHMSSLYYRKSASHGDLTADSDESDDRRTDNRTRPTYSSVVKR